MAVRLLELNDGTFDDRAHRDKVLYWYMHSALWGRYTGPTESTLQKDFDTAARIGVDGLISALERSRRGSLSIRPHHFEGTQGTRFYPLLYLLMRSGSARDLGTGRELTAAALESGGQLERHTLFPTALLRGHGTKADAIANFCFLAYGNDLEVGRVAPHEYLERAEAAQSFLEGLREGTIAEGRELQPLTVVTEEAGDPRSVQVKSLMGHLQEAGYAEPELDTAISDPELGGVIAEVEAFWPDGLQHGLGKPVVLEVDSEKASLPRLQELGYEVFTSVEALAGFVERLGREAAGGVEEETPAAEGIPPTPEAADFGKAMLSVYERAKAEAGYTPSFFLGMLSELGPLGTARKLLHAPAVSDGFSNLWERGRLDLTVEALVLRPEFSSLFTDEELDRARNRLEQFGYRFSDV